MYLKELFKILKLTTHSFIDKPLKSNIKAFGSTRYYGVNQGAKISNC